jgi:hypothetical protein
MRERDWHNLLWDVRRGRSLRFAGPDIGARGRDGLAEAAEAIATQRKNRDIRCFPSRRARETGTLPKRG